MDNEAREQQIKKQRRGDEVEPVRGDNSYRKSCLTYWYHESLDKMPLEEHNIISVWFLLKLKKFSNFNHEKDMWHAQIEGHSTK